MVFNSNLVKHFFVVDANTNITEVGTGDNKEVILTFDNEKTFSICKKHVDYVKDTTAAKMLPKLKKYTLKLDENVNEGAPVASQDYVVRIDFKCGAGFSAEDSYIKTAVARATSSMDAKALLTKLAVSIFENLKKVYQPAIEVAGGDSVAAKVKYDNKGNKVGLLDKDNAEIDFTNGIIIQAKDLSSEYKRGFTHVAPVDFKVIPTTIVLDGEEVEWGDVTKTETPATTNGPIIAEMEWYFMGDRADQERGTRGPRYAIDTKYVVDPTKSYDTLDVQYHWAGDRTENTGKSPIQLILVAEGDNKTKLGTIKTALA